MKLNVKINYDNVQDYAALDFIDSARDKNYTFNIDNNKLLYYGGEYFNNKFKGKVNFKNFDSAVVMTR